MGDKSELAELGLNNDSTLTNHQSIKKLVIS